VFEGLRYVFVNEVDGSSEASEGGVMEISPERSGRHRAAVQRGVAAATDVRPGTSLRRRPSGAHRGDDSVLARGYDPMGRPEDGPLFTRAMLDYAAHRPGQALMLLQAGCTTAGGEPDVARLRATGCDVEVSMVDDDSLTTRAAVVAHPELMSCTLGDLRTTPLPPRAFDIVHCALLLERISNAELVLDRFVEALKPGGLLLLSTGDRDCAAGFIDRTLPRSVRATIWRRQRPGEPGPYPAVFEHLASGRGIQSYALRRGLVIGPRQAVNQLAAQRSRGLLLASKLVARLSAGQLTSAHDELRYVIRKPENRFARVL
jgi:SAM-dependent methyltransferase